MGSENQVIRVVDSHTGGEPTRTILAGGPDLGSGPLKERLERFRRQHDAFRSAIVNEPRGSDVVVGAMVCEPSDPNCSVGVIFFNNVGYLGMCGHGTIGLIATLAYLKRIRAGRHRIETPVGIVEAELHLDGSISVDNVESYRYLPGAAVVVPEYGRVAGDVAWGGNWFYLVNGQRDDLQLSNVEALTGFTWAIRRALDANAIFGQDGSSVNHIELHGPPHDPRNQSRNFVLCPGKAYDRSPCGTGTSAKLACLFLDGKLREGEVWRQESILGSVFEGSVRVREGKIFPTIRGRAFVTAEADLILDPLDPFCLGIRR